MTGGVGADRSPRGGRLVGGGHQGGGVEVVDADLAGATHARQDGARGVGVDVDLVKPHAQGIRGTDDAHGVTDVLQVPAQLPGLDRGRLQQVHDLELAGGHAQGIGADAVGHPALCQVGEHLAGDGRVGSVLISVPVPLAQLRRLIRPAAGVLDRIDGVRQAGEQQHEGGAPGIHRAVPQTGGLHDGLLGAEGCRSGDGAQGRRRAGGRLLQSGPSSRGGVPGHGQQGSCHRAGDRGPGSVGHGLVGVDELDRPQAVGIRRVGADVGEGCQCLGDQQSRVTASTADGTVRCRAGHLGGIRGSAKAVESVGGRAQGEQDIGPRVGVRNGKDVEDVNEVSGLIGDDLSQCDPASHCGSPQHLGLRDRGSGAVSL